MNIKSVAVLCRGKSLSHINDLPDVDLYVIVNRFANELETEEEPQEEEEPNG